MVKLFSLFKCRALQDTSPSYYLGRLGLTQRDNEGQTFFECLMTAKIYNKDYINHFIDYAKTQPDMQKVLQSVCRDG